MQYHTLYWLAAKRGEELAVLVMDALQQLSFVLLLLSLRCPSEAKQTVQYITDEDEINSVPGEFFPYCVEVSDVSPPPHSILQPTYLEPKKRISHYTNYVFRVTFSRPVAISNNDTTGGWQPELLHIEIPRRRLDSYHYSVARGVKRAGFILDKVSPIFLTPSRTLLQKYYAVNIVNWQGSSKQFLIYFAVPSATKGPNLTLSQKVYLVIDGGRFYSFGKVRGSRHPIFVPTTIIGEFYFEEYVRRNAWFKPLPPVRFQPTPYCKQRTQRPLSVEGAGGHAVQQNLTARLNNDAHRLETSTNDNKLSLNLSLSVIGVGGTFSFVLPKVINVLYRKANVTVKLPDKLTIKVTKPLVAPKLFVPVKRVPVYELREGIYHNEPKIITTGMPPAFSYNVNFSDNAKDLREGLFPVIKLTTTSRTEISMEAIDMSMGIRLGEYFPFWELRSLNWNLLPYYEWMEVSRSAPIAARSDLVRYRFYVWANHKKLVTKYRFLADNSRHCPADSNRHSSGRSGATLEHVVDYGPLYHLMEPLHSSYWSMEDKTIDITLTNEKGTKTSASVHNPHSGVDLNIPSIISEGLRQYRCLLPPLQDIPKPSHPTVVNEKWHPLDKCIFVPTSVADSMECGGLKLFRNVSAVFRDKSFCNYSFGECVGLPFSSLKRFPVIPTFGLPELTGWTECPSDLCPLSTHQQHPSGRHYVDGTNTKAVPRSILKFSKTQNTPDITMDDIQMEFSPVYNADSRTEYTIVLEGVEIMEPVLSRQPLSVEDSTSLSATDCEIVWMLGTEPLSLNSIHPQEANLTATVYNIGQGGGRYLFDVQCSGYLSVHPELPVTMWMEPKTSANVTFVLSGLLAGSAPNLVHKCDLLIRLERDAKPALECSKWLTTYYGAFEFPCELKVDLPTVDIAYYVLPSSQYKSAHLQQFLDTVVNLQLVKVITLFLSVPSGQTEMLKMLHYLRVSCQSEDIMVLLDQQLLHGTLRYSMLNESNHMRPPVIIQDDFTAPKRVYFLAKRSWLESQHALTPPLSSCEVVLMGHSPNWVCQREERMLDRLSVPLTRADIERGVRDGLFKRQSDLVVTFVILCVVTGLVSALVVSLGILVLFVYRSRLPKNGTLNSLKRDLDKAKESDKEYWENPVMYLCPEASSASDSCQQYGEEHYGPHFTLHQWRATESLNTKDVKHLKIAGTLKYKMKELSVMFGHVKKIFSHSDKENGNVWVQASSGMYLLPMSTVASDYVTNMVELYKILCIAESAYKQLLEKKVDVIEEQDSGSKVDDKLKLNDDLEGLGETETHSPTHTSLEPSLKTSEHSKLAEEDAVDKVAAATETDSEGDETMPLL